MVNDNVVKTLIKLFFAPGVFNFSVIDYSSPCIHLGAPMFFIEYNTLCTIWSFFFVPFLFLAFAVSPWFLILPVLYLLYSLAVYILLFIASTVSIILNVLMTVNIVIGALTENIGCCS
jgi:hypothetical protein